MSYLMYLTRWYFVAFLLVVAVAGWLVYDHLFSKVNSKDEFEDDEVI